MSVDRAAEASASDTPIDLTPTASLQDISSTQRTYLRDLARTMPRLYYEHVHVYDAGGRELYKTAVQAACNTMSRLPRGIYITIGYCGTYGTGAKSMNRPFIGRGQVSMHTGDYAYSRGWDPAKTRALIVGWDLPQDVLRNLEIELIREARHMPHINIVEGSDGGHGRWSQGPVRVIYFNQLRPGLTGQFVRDAIYAEKQGSRPMRVCGRCGEMRGCSGGPCAGCKKRAREMR